MIKRVCVTIEPIKRLYKVVTAYENNNMGSGAEHQPWGQRRSP